MRFELVQLGQRVGIEKAVRIVARLIERHDDGFVLRRPGVNLAAARLRKRARLSSMSTPIRQNTGCGRSWPSSSRAAATAKSAFSRVMASAMRATKSAGNSGVSQGTVSKYGVSQRSSPVMNPASGPA